jgi:hypothetical protein
MPVSRVVGVWCGRRCLSRRRVFGVVGAGSVVSSRVVRLCGSVLVKSRVVWVVVSSFFFGGSSGGRGFSS